MKKMCGYALAIVCVASFTACNRHVTTAKLETELDSLNYAFGVANGADIKQYVLGNDSSEAALKGLVRGFGEGFASKKVSDRLYNEGRSIGVTIKDQIKEGFLFRDSSVIANEEAIFNTIYDILHGKEVGMTAQEAQTYFVSVMGYYGSANQPAIRTQERIDSLNKAFAVANGFGIKQYVLADDTIEAAALVKGLKYGVKHFADAGIKFYVSGLQIATNVNKQLSAGGGLTGDSLLEAKIDIVKAGMFAAFLNDTTQMSVPQARTYYQEKIQAHKDAQTEKEYGANRIAGEEFLAENAKRPQIKITDSGLQYEIIKAGRGALPTASDRVKVHYEGTLIDGTVFDSSIERGNAAVFGVTQVIPGWTEALKLMPVGSKWRIYIPQELGYGSRGSGQRILPFSALIFYVELLGIEK
ncbi:MAG: FKBP-type peptidyl-prolyl cis-trans isomerase [Prevotellaceae bacterium]|jgi:FKBP-type peptidyl-prolyl cis-trans isomerase|nr:FKBP-type peptidyl-prolyl cis-trans isomerase [Prevotellaceae bacterium]